MIANTRTSGGAIQASGSRLVRSRWARVFASTEPFFTLAEEMALVASGWAHVGGDASVGEEVGEPAPSVGLKSDLEDAGPSSPKTRRDSSGLDRMLQLASSSPSSARTATWEDLRCRSTPT